MSNKSYRPMLERLEQRHLFAAVLWFEDTGQALGANHDAIELGDLDGDGDLDALVGCRNLPDAPSCSASQVWLNRGSGRFSAGWSGGRLGVNEIALGDLDKDGDLDAFVTKASPFGNQANEVWLNDGQGDFADSGQRLNDIARDVSLADVDGDDDLDAITAGVNTPSKVWLNNGLGEFTNSGQRLAEDGWSFSVALGDVDGDGDVDAWFGRGLDSASYVDRLYVNDGVGNFTDSGQRLNTVSTGDVQFRDLDGDGDVDAYLANGNQRGNRVPDQVWMNDGTGTFTDSGQRLARSTGKSVELGDLDGDGDADAVVGNGGTLGIVNGQANQIWLNGGTGVFTLAQELGDAATTAVALGDIDNDGDLDALFANLGQDNQVWINTLRLAGDANRDGMFNQLDIVQILQSAKYQTSQPATWTDGDFNRDGVFSQLDIVAALQTGMYTPTYRRCWSRSGQCGYQCVARPPANQSRQGSVGSPNREVAHLTAARPARRQVAFAF